MPDVTVGSMDPFVRRLIQRMHDPARPLSRNRHFHTFSTPEGQMAVRISRRLRSIRADILACRDEGHAAQFVRHTLEDGTHRIEIRLERVSGRRVSILSGDEFELLTEMPEVAPLLQQSAA